MTFPSLPVAAPGGRGGTWAAGGSISQGLALAVRGRLKSPATNHCIFCCYRGLEDGVVQLQGFWQWPGTDVFSGMSLRLCKGMSPWHFFSYKISPTFPICLTMGHRESCLATLQLQWTLQKYQQEILQLKIVAAVPPSCREACRNQGAAVAPIAPRGFVSHGAHTQFILLSSWLHPSCAVQTPWHTGSCWMRPARSSVGLQWSVGFHPACDTQNHQGQLMGNGFPTSQPVPVPTDGAEEGKKCWESQQMRGLWG